MVKENAFRMYGTNVNGLKMRWHTYFQEDTQNIAHAYIHTLKQIERSCAYVPTHTHITRKDTRAERKRDKKAEKRVMNKVLCSFFCRTNNHQLKLNIFTCSRIESKSLTIDSY